MAWREVAGGGRRTSRWLAQERCLHLVQGPGLKPHCSASFVPQQVNGTMVTNSSHLEVVKLIKCELQRADP